jgi:ribosomal protein S18 acetylase RimI-like enzyme
MSPEAGAYRFVELDASRRTAMAAIAEAAFRGNPFYEQALGLDERSFPVYWEEFFHFVLRDPAATAFALEWDGTIAAAVAVAVEGFPSTRSLVRFLARLLVRLGPRRWLRYVRFGSAYERVMRRPPAEHRIEARGLWLFVQPGTRSIGLGARLVRQAMETMRRRGKPLITGFVDANNRPLLMFYRRLGFHVQPPFRFAGMDAARIECWCIPAEVQRAC